MTDEIIIALQFLTIIKIDSRYGKLRGEELAKSMVWFPLVGLFLGAFLLLENFFFLYFFPKPVVDAILIISLVLLTGALHLDGLADCADAFYAGGDKKEILTIMKDTYLGSMGVVALICVLGLKWICLFSMLPVTKNKALLLMPVMGRWGMVFITALSPYARNTQGLGRAFADYVDLNVFFKASAIPIILAISFLNIREIILIMLIPALCYCLARYAKQTIGGITGDVLGAVNEILEVTSLLIMLILYPNPGGR